MVDKTDRTQQTATVVIPCLSTLSIISQIGYWASLISSLSLPLSSRSTDSSCLPTVLLLSFSLGYPRFDHRPPDPPPPPDESTHNRHGDTSQLCLIILPLNTHMEHQNDDITDKKKVKILIYIFFNRKLDTWFCLSVFIWPISIPSSNGRGFYSSSH